MAPAGSPTRADSRAASEQCGRQERARAGRSTAWMAAPGRGGIAGPARACRPGGTARTREWARPGPRPRRKAARRRARSPARCVAGPARWHRPGRARPDSPQGERARRPGRPGHRGHREDDERQAPATPHAMKSTGGSRPLHASRDAPRVEDALERGEVGEDGEHDHGRGEQVEGGARDEDDEPLGTLHQPDLARHPDGLGARLRVAHHHRAHEGGQVTSRAAPVSPCGRIEHDAQQHDQVGVAVHHRVEEGAERRDLAASRASEPSKKSKSPATARSDGAGAEPLLAKAHAARRSRRGRATVRWLAAARWAPEQRARRRLRSRRPRSYVVSLSQRLAARGLFEGLAEPVHHRRVLEPPPLPVRHVERVVRLLDLGGDARARDVEAEAPRTCA